MSNTWKKNFYGRRDGKRSFFKPRFGNFHSSKKLPFPPQLNTEHPQTTGVRACVDPIDVQDETILCMSYGQGLLGAAVYEQSNQAVRLMYDISEDQQYRNVKTLIDSVNPTVIIVNSNQDLNFINWLSSRYNKEEECNGEEPSTSIPKWNPTETLQESKEESDCEEVDDDESDFENEDNVRLLKLPNGFFRYTKGLKRINETMVNDNKTLNAQEKETILKMRIDVESVNTIRSFGCLLFYLDDCRLGVESKPLNVKTPIKSITTFVIEHHVEIDFNSYTALNILPKTSGGKKGSKDQNNLFHLMNKCNSSVGQRLMRKWFLNPTTNLEILRARQRCIHFFSQDCNIDITVKLMRLLKNASGLNHIFSRFQAGTAQLMHWNGFIKTMTSLCQIMEIIKDTSVKKELIEENFNLKDLSELIVIAKSIIDFDDSLNEGRVSICAGVDNLLDEYRMTYRSLPSFLTAIAEQESKRLGIEDDSNCSCIYVPLLGYLLSLPNTFPISEHPDMTLVYKTDTEIRVKNEMTARLEEDVGDIRMQIIDKETAILLRLKKMILTKRRKLIYILSVAAKVDVLISFARVACEMGWNCPSLVDQPVLEAVSLYHPLSERVTNKEFVPNNVTSGSNGVRVSIITGPNACGKSMYLKQIGVLAFLSHIGSFVPARKARIGPIDRIMTRLFTLDTVLDGMSTFAKDVEQVAIAVNKSTVNSLVIIDEFGKGTMMEVGLSLLASCMTHWIQKGPEQCPHLFVSSHFHSLPKYIPLNNTMVTFLTFRVHRLSGGRIEYLYKLVDGLVDCSFAMAVAKQSGLKIPVVGRACQVYDSLRNQKPLSQVALICSESDIEFLEHSMGRMILDENLVNDINELVEHCGHCEKEDENEENNTEVQSDGQERNNTGMEEFSKDIEDGNGDKNSMELQTETNTKSSTRKSNDEREVSRKRSLPVASSSKTSQDCSLSFLNSLLPPSQQFKRVEETGMRTPPKSPNLFYSSDSEEVLSAESTPKKKTMLTPILRRMSSQEEEEKEEINQSSSHFSSPHVIYSKPSLNSTRNSLFASPCIQSPLSESFASSFGDSRQVSPMFPPDFDSFPRSSSQSNRVHVARSLSQVSSVLKTQLEVESEKAEFDFDPSNDDPVFGNNNTIREEREFDLSQVLEERSLLIDTQHQSTFQSEGK